MSKNEFICDCNIIHKKSVEKALNMMPKDEIFYKLADFYKLIGDTTRCKILFAISNHEMCVCDIANVLSMSKSSDDDHISKVFKIGLEHINHKM